MKKESFLFMGIVIIFALTSITANAYCHEVLDFGDKVELGVYAMGVFPEAKEFETATPGGGGYLRYYVSDSIAIEGSVEFARWDFESVLPGFSGKMTGDLDVVPIHGTVMYIYNSAYNIKFYLGGGITGMLIEGDVRGTLTPGGNAQITFDNGLGAHLGGGVNWAFTKDLWINADAKYTWVKSETNETLDTGTLIYDDMDMHNYALRGSVAYKF